VERAGFSRELLRPLGPPPSGTETILLVEDDGTVRLLASKLLASLGYTTLVASSGEEAVELAAHVAQPIDLVLTDMVMPGMGGLQVAAALSEMLPAVPVIYMSGFSAELGMGQRTLAEGMAFLQKPFTISTLAHAVRQALDEPRSPTRQVDGGIAALVAP
jgi:CheY-like chemotaxis protein